MEMLTSDKDIRAVVLNSIAIRAFEDKLSHRVIEEMGICRGVARVDIAVIEDTIHGYEIKSDRDTLRRLPNQIDLYSKVLDYITLVCGSSHIEKIKSMVPSWWGLSEAKSLHGVVTIYNIRPPTMNPLIDLSSLLELLWKNELIDVLKETGNEKSLSGKNRKYLVDKIILDSNHQQIASLVKNKLYTRKDWRE